MASEEPYPYVLDFSEKLFLTSFVCAAQTTRKHCPLQTVCYSEDVSLKNVCAPTSTSYHTNSSDSSHLFTNPNLLSSPQPNSNHLAGLRSPPLAVVEPLPPPWPFPSLLIRNPTDRHCTSTYPSQVSLPSFVPTSPPPPALAATSITIYLGMFISSRFDIYSPLL